jgi:ribonuclease HI
MHYLYFDGSCTPNPGVSGGTGYVVKDNEMHTIHTNSTPYFGEPVTNNIMEYRALINGCNWCAENGIKMLTIYGDSLLVVMQVTKKWRVNLDHLRLLRDTAACVMAKFDYVVIEHIPREQNTEADKLSDER